MVGNDERGKPGVMKPQTLRFNCNNMQEGRLGRPCHAENPRLLLTRFAHQNVGDILCGLLHTSKMKSLLPTSVLMPQVKKTYLGGF